VKKIINVCYDDYANYMHGITMSLRAAGADCKEFKMIAHPFGYHHQAPVCRIEDMIPHLQEADVINIFHTSTIFIPVIKNLTHRKYVTVWHTGTKFRQDPDGMNEIFKEVDAVFTDQCEFFALLPSPKGGRTGRGLGMKSGLLDKRIVIQSATLAQDTMGQMVPTWSTHATVWADLIPIKGDEVTEANRLTQKVDFRVRIRYLSTLTIDMRVSYNSAYYDIVSINELGRKDGYELFIQLHRDPL